MPHNHPHHIKRIWVIGLSALLMLGIVAITPSLIAWDIGGNATPTRELPSQPYNASVVDTIRN